MLHRWFNSYRRSIRLRLVAPILTALTVGVGLLAMVSGALLWDSLCGSAEQAALRRAQSIAANSEVKADLMIEMLASIRASVSQAMDDDHIQQVTVYGLRSDGMLHPVWGTERSDDGLQEHSAKPRAASWIETSQTPHHDPETDLLAVATPVYHHPAGSALFATDEPPTVLGAVELHYSLASARQQAAMYRWLLLLVAGLLLTSAAFLTDRIASRILSPLMQVDEAMSEATHGDLGVRLPATGEDEVGSIMRSFNSMVRTLDENHREIDSQRRTLEVRVAERTMELSRANEELRTLDLAKDTFLSSVSHEMRTPLTSIIAATEILRSYSDDPLSREEFTKIIEKEAQRLQRIIGSVLEIVDLEANQTLLALEEFDLIGLVRGSIGQLEQELSEKELHVEQLGMEHSMPITADASMMGKVLQAVLSNAINFSPAREAITVRVSSDQDHAWISIRDRGPGVPAAKQSEIFTMFMQHGEILTEKPQGLGLGLALSARVVAEHEGSLLYKDPETGPGACFVIGLPLAGPAQSGSRKSTAAGQAS